MRCLLLYFFLANYKNEGLIATSLLGISIWFFLSIVEHNKHCLLKLGVLWQSSFWTHLWFIFLLGSFKSLCCYAVNIRLLLTILCLICGTSTLQFITSPSYTPWPFPISYHALTVDGEFYFIFWVIDFQVIVSFHAQ